MKILKLSISRNKFWFIYTIFSTKQNKWKHDILGISWGEYPLISISVSYFTMFSSYQMSPLEKNAYKNSTFLSWSIGDALLHLLCTSCQCQTKFSWKNGRFSNRTFMAILCQLALCLRNFTVKSSVSLARRHHERFGLCFKRRSFALWSGFKIRSGLDRSEKCQPKTPNGAIFVFEKHQNIFGSLQRSFQSKRDGFVPAFNVIWLYGFC